MLIEKLEPAESSPMGACLSRNKGAGGVIYRGRFISPGLQIPVHEPHA